MIRGPAPFPPVIRALLAGAVDYAGLFPPADLDMQAALENYLAYRESPDAWALGRFVVPIARLEELEAGLREVGGANGRPLALSALIGTGTADDVDVIERLNRESVERGARAASVEVKAGSEGVARAVLAAIPRRWVRYLEVPPGPGMDAALDAAQQGGACVKLRTGGTTPDAIPAPDQVFAFIAAAARRKLPFKATAGLHHPMRGTYPLTYAADSPRAPMHGYVNLLLASAILWSHGAPDRAEQALLEEDPDSVRINGDALVWRDQRLDGHVLTAMRTNFFHGFGSCSFVEPLDELPAWNGR